MNVIPTCCWIALSSICISSRSLRSSAPSGSSRSSTRGRLTSARASATRCRWPPDSWLGFALLVALEADHPQRFGDPGRRARRAGTLRTTSPYPTLSPTRHVREQRVVLEDRVDVAVERRDRGHVLRRGAGSGPRSAARSPAIIRSVVVLPEPDGPSIEKNSPSRTSRSIPSTATTSPKRFWTPSRRTAVAAPRLGAASTRAAGPPRDAGSRVGMVKRTSGS